MRALPWLAEQAKTISFFPGWSKPEEETGYVWFDAPLEIGGVTERAFFLHGGCYADKPDCNLTFEMRIGKELGRRCIPLTRFCWRSLKGGHSNPRRTYMQELSGQRVGPTHFHPFALNYDAIKQRMRDPDLRCAMEINAEFQTFMQVRLLVGSLFRINNIDVVEAPPWEYKLPFGPPKGDT